MKLELDPKAEATPLASLQRVEMTKQIEPGALADDAADRPIAAVAVCSVVSASLPSAIDRAS